MKILSALFKNGTEKQTIFKNTFWLSSSMILENLIRFLVMIWIARFYGPSNYGILVFVLSFVTFFSAFSDIGLSNLTIREVSKDASLAKLYTQNVTALKIALGTITYAFMIAVISLLNKGDGKSIEIAIFLGLYAILNSFSIFFQSFFRANQKMEQEALSRSIQNLSLLAIVFFIISKDMKISDIGFAFFISAVIGLTTSIYIIAKNYSTSFFNINIQICREIIKKAWPFGFSIIAVSVYENFDSILLGITRSNEEVGYYGAAYKIAMMSAIFSSIISSSFFPLLSKKHKEGVEQMRNSADNLSKTLLIFAWPILIGSLVFSDSIILAIYGSEYRSSIFIFQVLILSKILIYFTAIFGQVVQAANRQRSHFKITSKGAALNIILNLILVPTFGINGSAFASLATSIYILFKMRSASKKIIPINNIRNSIIPVIASTPMIFIVHLTSFSLIYQIIICAILYFMLLFLMIKFIDKSNGTS